MDFMPYLSGISENAIQYMQESEYESRFHETDQGTITFRRYHGQFSRHHLWLTDFAYDHPARDLAEFIRNQLLQTEDPMDGIQAFLEDYQQVRPLSVFSWRLLYARLLFPIHFFFLMSWNVDSREDLIVIATQLYMICRNGSQYMNEG